MTPQHPSFRTLFVKAPSEGMAGPPDDAQDEYVAIVEAALALPENAALKASRGDEITASKLALETAETAQTEFEKREAVLDAKLEQVSAAARRAFNAAQLDAASLVKDEALVASLFDFRKTPKKKKKEE